MNEQLPQVLSRISTTQLALENLRAKSPERALELLEIDLDAGVLALSRLAKELEAAERARVTSTLQQIRVYRRLHPRRVEADLSDIANGVLVRSGRWAQDRAAKILDKIE